MFRITMKRAMKATGIFAACFLSFAVGAASTPPQTIVHTVTKTRTVTLTKTVKVPVYHTVVKTVARTVTPRPVSHNPVVKPAAVPRPTPVPAPVIVDGTTLAQQFDANKVVSLAYYKVHTVQTDGIATNVSQDILGTYYVAFKPADENYSGLTSMQCDVSGPEALASVVNGQRVTVRGRIDDQFWGLITIKDCSVVK